MVGTGTGTGMLTNSGPLSLSGTVWQGIRTVDERSLGYCPTGAGVDAGQQARAVVPGRVVAEVTASGAGAGTRAQPRAIGTVRLPLMPGLAMDQRPARPPARRRQTVYTYAAIFAVVKASSRAGGVCARAATHRR
jgi:hypothetical protein